jgi:NOL1/NOP2/fmu family ribosome biogenesis protein
LLRIQAVGLLLRHLKDVAQHTLRLRHQRSNNAERGIRIAPSHPLIYRLSQQLTIALKWTSVQNCTVCEVTRNPAKHRVAATAQNSTNQQYGGPSNK